MRVFVLLLLDSIEVFFLKTDDFGRILMVRDLFDVDALDDGELPDEEDEVSQEYQTASSDREGDDVSVLAVRGREDEKKD